ncbi:uncharacterized protein LOC119443999 [Dermacentor silvarum]|uniref:uncharacterized protein LOC119443999 n=1 Tax=Dermacentor silvarum TaxID=543639 RepID=UPI0021007660|nr:uncharacterized protein LOC119443999 [Dermacentor silvarum]
MKPLRIAGLLIAFMAYGLQTSQAQDTYTYAIDGGGLSGNIIEDRPTGPRGERTFVDENSVLSRRGIGDAYDATNYLDGEEGDSYTFRNRDSSQYVGTKDGLSQHNYVVFDRPRPESEDDSGSRRENEGWEATGGPRFLSSLFGNAGQPGQEGASSLPSTSGRRHSGSGFGEEDYVVLGGEEPRRRESVDGASDGAYLEQFFKKGSRQRAVDEFSAPGAEEGQRGLPRTILGPFIRNTEQTKKIEGFHQVPKLHGRQSYLAADYLGNLNGGPSNGVVQNDGSIEIISDGSHQGSLLALLEGSDDREQNNPRSRSLESVRGASGDGTDSGGSLAEIFVAAFERTTTASSPYSVPLSNFIRQ